MRTLHETLERVFKDRPEKLEQCRRIVARIQERIFGGEQNARGARGASTNSKED